MMRLIKLFFLGYKCPQCKSRSHFHETIISHYMFEAMMICNWCYWVSNKDKFKGELK